MTPQTDNLVKEIITSGHLKTPEIVSAFQKIDRIDFVPDEEKNSAYLNEALPISCGQTISQPLTVAFMLELLQPKLGDRVLEIGTGSGWQTALLSEIVGNLALSGGKVYSVEIIPELSAFGRKNVAKYEFIKNGVANFYCFNAVKGLLEQAPFDKIISGASCQEIPQAWKEQLKIGGRMVAPVKNAIHLLVKKGENNFDEQIFQGFSFVPFVDK